MLHLTQVFLPPWWLNPSVGGNKSKTGNEKNKEIQMIMLVGVIKKKQQDESAIIMQLTYIASAVSGHWEYCRYIYQRRLHLFVCHLQVSVIQAQRHNKLAACCWEHSLPWRCTVLHFKAWAWHIETGISKSEATYKVQWWGKIKVYPHEENDLVR